MVRRSENPIFPEERKGGLKGIGLNDNRPVGQFFEGIIG